MENINGPEFWLILAGIVLRRKPLPISLFKKSFKLSPILVGKIFQLLRVRFAFTRPKHLLWTLFYLKTSTVGEELIALNLGTNKKTLRQYLIQTLRCLDIVLPDVCSFLLKS